MTDNNIMAAEQKTDSYTVNNIIISAASKSVDVTIRRTNTKLGNRAFRVAGSCVWNNRPGAIQATKTLPPFKKRLHNSKH